MMTYDVIKNFDSFMTVPPKQTVIGDMSYIISKLKEWSKSRTMRTQKYPLMAILENYPEKESASFIDVTLQVALINDSRNNFNNDDRNARIMEQLQPVYESLLDSLRKNPAIFPGYSFEHEKVTRLDIGRNSLLSDDAASPDYIDAIELRNLQLKIHKKILKL